MTQFNNELYAGFLPEAGDARFEGKRGFYPAMTAEEYRALPLPMKCATWDARVQYVIFDSYFRDLVVNDEVASWRGDGGLKQYEVMKSALGARRQPMILSISTAGYENDGIFDELMKRSTAFLKGGSKERRLLPLLYMIDDVEKWNDL